MFLTYKPEGSEAPRRWAYDPKRLMSPEMEKIEHLTGRPYMQFVGDVQKGSAVCRRALLFIFLKREHPTLRYEDVQFAWGEVDFVYGRGELEEMRAEIAERAPADQRDGILAELDKQIADAPEDAPQGKAPAPSAA